MHIQLKVNGSDHARDVDTRSVLLDVLREQLGLTIADAKRRMPSR